MKVVPIKNNFPSGFYQALGKLAVAFGRVEYEIKLAVKSLSGEGFTQGMVEAESSGQFSKLCKKAKTLAAQNLHEPHLSKFSELVDDALSLARNRNDNLHALWTTDENDKPFRYRPYFSSKTKKLGWRSCPVTITELNSHTRTFVELHHKLYEARKAWPTIKPQAGNAP